VFNIQSIYNVSVKYCPERIFLNTAFGILAVAFSALTLLVGRQEGHPACKKMGDGGGEH